MKKPALLLVAFLLFTACDDMLDVERPIYERFINRVSMAGDATDGIWDLELVTTMDHIGGRTHQLDVQLKAGELKFAWQIPDFLAGSWYMATAPGLPVEKGVPYDLVFVNRGLANNNWRITEAGSYRVTVDLFDNTVVFNEVVLSEVDVPDLAAVYIIGAATTGGWDLNLASPMTKTGTSWVWNGTLSPAGLEAGGGLKFICKLNDTDALNYNSSPEFRPVSNGAVPTIGNEQVIVYVPDGALVNNYTFTITTAGTYTITLNPNTRRVLFTAN